MPWAGPPQPGRGYSSTHSMVPLTRPWDGRRSSRARLEGYQGRACTLWARGWEMAVEIESPGHPEACPLPYAQDLWCYGKNASPRASLLVFPVAKTPHSQCRGPRFNPWSGNPILHATMKKLQVTTQLKISHATMEAHVPQLRPDTAK